MKFIIEHLEEKLWPWCIIEYRHISKLIGKKNLIFTNVRFKKDCDRLAPFGKAYKESFRELGLPRVCVLDPSSEKTLSRADAGRFDHLAFGGILGTYPMQLRTKKLISGYGSWETRNLGDRQMPTDNAVYVAKKIVEGMNFEEFRFQDWLVLETGKGEAVELPYRYALVDGKPLIAAQLVQHLKKAGGF
ncbi:hypothetical protein HYU13_02215 [Candidatus Woesearchaeota archaeon]|nr:hypothetical protein [Candidatus Woesearchaeota archaeon]